MSADFREVAAVVEGAEGVELLERTDEGVWWWGVHEVEIDEVVDTERLEQKNDADEVRALDLRGGALRKIIVEGPFCEETEAFAWSRTSSSSRTLIRRSSRYRNRD